MLRQVLLTFALLLFGLVSTPPALAQSQLDVLLEEGRELQRANRFEEALQRFQSAHRIAPSGRTLAEMGMLEVALGRWVDAEQHLAAALATQDPFVAQLRSGLEQNLSAARQRIGRLEIAGGVPGAVVRVNGIERGRLPLAQPLAVEVGTAIVEVTADGYHPMQRSVNITRDVLAREELRLVSFAEAPTTRVVRVREGGGIALDATVGWVVTGAAAVSSIGLAIWQGDRVGALATCRVQPCTNVSEIHAEHDLSLALAGFAGGLGIGALASALHLSFSSDYGISRALFELVLGGAFAVGALVTGGSWAERDGAYQSCLAAGGACTNPETLRNERNAVMFTSMALTGGALSALSVGLLALTVTPSTSSEQAASCSPSLGGLSCSGRW